MAGLWQSRWQYPDSTTGQKVVFLPAENDSPQVFGSTSRTGTRGSLCPFISRPHNACQWQTLSVVQTPPAGTLPQHRFLRRQCLWSSGCFRSLFQPRPPQLIPAPGRLANGTDKCSLCIQSTATSRARHPAAATRAGAHAPHWIPIPLGPP